jgi:hypothetical protein
MADWFSDVEVFAVYRSAGQWSVMSPVVRELSGRYGVRRIAAQRDHLLLRSSRRRANTASGTVSGLLNRRSFDPATPPPDVIRRPNDPSWISLWAADQAGVVRGAAVRCSQALQSAAICCSLLVFN